MRAHAFFLAMATTCAVITPGLARAEAPSATDAARAAFERGANLAAGERWLEALAEFESSAQLRPHATTTYNIGYCLRALGRATHAKKMFEQALREDDAVSGAQLTADLRASAAKYIDEAKTQIATPTLSIDPPDATVTIDGRPLEAAGAGRFLGGIRPPGPGEKVSPAGGFVVELDGGTHEIVVVAADDRSIVVHEFFPPGSKKLVHVVVPPPPPRVDKGAARRTWGLALGLAGIASLGVGTYFGLHARSLWNQAKDACPDRLRCPNDDASRLSGDAKTAGNLATISFVVGAGALLGGTILILTTPSGEPKAIVSGSIDPRGGGGLSLTGRF